MFLAYHILFKHFGGPQSLTRKSALVFTSFTSSSSDMADTIWWGLLRKNQVPGVNRSTTQSVTLAAIVAAFAEN